MILINDNMLDALKTMEDNSVDSIITDPPYHLTSIVKRFGPGQKGVKHKDGAAGAYSRASKGFMGKEWDGGDIAFRPETWEECWRVLKPGGYLLSFSSARTYHRMAVAIEDAGYEIRDQVMWLYGSGFPKSHNIGKNYDKKYGIEREDLGANPNNRPNPDNKDNATHDYGITSKSANLTKGYGPYEGWGTALKPAHEPICVARKPLSEKTVLANMEKWGVGGLNIEASRVGDEVIHNDRYEMPSGYRLADNTTNNDLNVDGANAVRHYVDGRWPANLIHDGSDEVVEHFPNSKGGHWPDSKTTGGGESWGGSSEYNGTGPKDKVDGSAARFFYVPKVSKKERNEGLEGSSEGLYANDGRTKTNDTAYQRGNNVSLNTHPTVKPIALMEYLIKMVTPTGGVVLDPFMGSGSTGCAAVSNGFDFVGIEMEESSFDIANKRIEHWGKS